MCAKLMCTGGNDYPIAGTIARGSRGYVQSIGSKKQLTCDSASIDLGQDVPDPGYVANGSPCGHGKVSCIWEQTSFVVIYVRCC